MRCPRRCARHGRSGGVSCVVVVGSDFCAGAVAQLGERLICIQEVVGSTPIGSTIQELGVRLRD
jgi:hypothetical protein